MDVLSSDSAPGSNPENGLLGSGSSWIPNSPDSTISFSIKSVNDTAEFHNLVFKVKNAEKVLVSLVDADGVNITSKMVCTIVFDVLKV